MSEKAQSHDKSDEQVCEVCGGRPSACRVLGHRPENDRPEWRNPVVKSARDEALSKIEKAHQHVADLAAGREKWTLRIPARPDMDSDLIIADALASAKKLIEGSTPSHVVPATVETPRTDALVERFQQVMHERRRAKQKEDPARFRAALIKHARGLERELVASSATAPTANVAAYTDRIGELEEVIQELVHLKDMHDEIERISPKDLSEPRNYHAEKLDEEYKNRKPKAWQRARECLE